jgi:hypothetical protein
MERLETLAQISVARGCGFGALAVFCTMIGLSATPILALKTGAVLCLVGCLVLVFKAEHAPRRPYRRTEVWLMLEPGDRPQEQLAQRLVGQTLQRTFTGFAVYYGIAAFAMFGSAIVLRIVTALSGLDLD